jgi:hypothetical protein
VARRRSVSAIRETWWVDPSSRTPRRFSGSTITALLGSPRVLGLRASLTPQSLSGRARLAQSVRRLRSFFFPGACLSGRARIGLRKGIQLRDVQVPSRPLMTAAFRRHEVVVSTVAELEGVLRTGTTVFFVSVVGYRGLADN